MASPSLMFILTSSLLFFSCPSLAQKNHNYPPLTDNGLSWTFYDDTCPLLENIVRNHLAEAFDDDIGLAAGLLRIHFHDCFVQGCDGSVLLTGTDSNPSEQASIPNLTLRPKALAVVNNLKEQIDEGCGPVVSCADIAALAARESVLLSGGPYYDIPYGRRDSLTFASNATVLANLPAPFFNVSLLLTFFQNKGLDAADLVALSGAHTIGIGHCVAFTNRLYPTQDPTLNGAFAEHLYATCPTTASPNSTVMDIQTPDAFDNKYFVDLVNHQGLFTSDQALFTDERTQPIVKKFAKHGRLFFEKFAQAMVKMSQLNVLTGANGEIRRDCSVPNSFGLSRAY